MGVKPYTGWWSGRGKRTLDPRSECLKFIKMMLWIKTNLAPLLFMDQCFYYLANVSALGSTETSPFGKKLPLLVQSGHG